MDKLLTIRHNMYKLNTIKEWDNFITNNFHIEQRMVGDMDIFYTLDTKSGGAEIMLTYTHDTETPNTHEVLFYPNRDHEECFVLASFQDNTNYTREEVQDVIR